MQRGEWGVCAGQQGPQCGRVLGATVLGEGLISSDCGCSRAREGETGSDPQAGVLGGRQGQIGNSRVGGTM